MAGKGLLVIIFVCFLAQTDAFSQNRDSLSAQADTSKNSSQKPAVFKDSTRLALENMTRRATMKSAMLPGLGQIYNKRWWKVPLVYGGFVGIGLVYEFNQRYYKIFLMEAQYRELNPGKTKNPLFAGYTNQGIITIKDSYRRNRDLSILAGLGFYAINIIDAYIDSKFFRFDISDELSLRVNPSVQQPVYIHSSAIAPVAGIKISLSL